MPLTPAQYITLRDAILADPALNAHPNDPDGNSAIAVAFNLPAAPDYWVWRTRVTRDEYTQRLGPEGTTFAWTGAGFITRSQGERDAWAAIFGTDGTVNPSLANVRQAFLDIFSGGTAPAPANRTHLAAVSRRKATRAETLFATGPGNGTTGTPATLTFEGDLLYPDVETARNS